MDNNLQSFISRDEMFLIVERTLDSVDFDLKQYEIKPASDSPTGFLGVHAKIRATVTTPGSDRPKRLDYFVKKIPTAVSQHLDYALRTRAFYKEIELFKTLFVDLRKAQDGAATRTKWRPEYYFSRGEEIIVTEDLTAHGYYMLPERSLMDEEHIRASLEAMAAMHAASFVFEAKFNAGEVDTVSPVWKGSERGGVVLGRDLYPHLTFETEASDEEGHPGNTYYEAGIRGQVNLVDLLPGLGNAEREKVKRELPGVLRRMMQLVKTSSKYRNAFVHGDPWSNNLMFRKSDGATTALLIDFQLARYAPPAHDVMLLLHLVQTDEFRRRRQRHLLDYYYDRFSDELTRNHLSPEEILPKEVFLESCDEYHDLGLTSSILYFQLTLAPPEITAKFLSSTELYLRHMMIDRTEMLMECFHGDDVFRTRMTEAMNHLIRRLILCDGDKCQ